MKNKLLIAVSMAFSTALSYSAVTLQFNQPFSTTGGVASNFANASGVATNGMVWGIIIDTNGSGFQTTYDQFTPTAGSSMILGSGGVATTNLLVTSNVNTANNSSSFELSGAFVQENGGGDGGIGAVTNIAFGGSDGVTQGDAFRLVWFNPSGNSAGFISNGSFVIPADGNTADVSAIFRGADPLRPATGITIVPEPSTLLLSALGALALLRRKR